MVLMILLVDKIRIPVQHSQSFKQLIPHTGIGFLKFNLSKEKKEKDI